jgi:glutaredoxin
MLLLFTVHNCPQCKESKDKLKRNNLEYREILVTDSIENAALAARYDIKFAGTIIDDETGKIVEILD